VTDWADSHAVDGAVHPPAISFTELLPWAIFAIALLALVGLVSFAPNAVLHEIFHDGRHLLAFPCD